MNQQQIKTLISETEAHIAHLTKFLKYADGPNYYNDKRRISELSQRLVHLNAKLMEIAA